MLVISSGSKSVDAMLGGKFRMIELRRRLKISFLEGGSCRNLLLKGGMTNTARY